MLNKIIHPTLVARDIIIRTNKGENTENLERYIGKSYPLIRILDRTVDQGAIRDFSYKIGSDLLPEISLTIEDYEVRLREVLKTNIDTITVYISNNIDGTFSKQEYILSSISSSVDEASMTLTAILYVPEFFKRDMRVFKGNSMQVLETLCSEVGLGLASNFTPNDEMTRIQDNCTNLDFIRRIVDTADCMAVHCFIDQWSYLNFVDVKLAHQSPDIIEIDFDPYSGEQLEETQNLVLSNNTLDTKRVGKIAVWATTDDYGLKSLSYVSNYDLEGFDLIELQTGTNNEQILAEAEELRMGKRKMLPQSDNVWSGYFKSKYYGGYISDTLNQSSEMLIRMQNPIHALYPSLNLPVEIYNVQKRGEYYNNEDKDLTSAEMPMDTAPESRMLVKNEMYSGQYYLNVVEMRYVDNLIEQRLSLRQI